MKLRELYQQNYFNEHGRKDSINNSIVIPLGIISVVVGGGFVVAGELDSPFSGVEEFQIAVICLMAISIIFSAYYLTRTFWGYKYHHVPTSDEIRLYYEELIQYYLQTGLNARLASKSAENEAIAHLSMEYSLSSTKNAENNDAKQGRLFRATGFTVLSVFFLLVSAVPFMYREITESNGAQKVEIVNMKEIAMSVGVDQKNSQESQEQPPLAPSQPLAIEQPVPPKSKAIFEHSIPVKKESEKDINDGK